MASRASTPPPIDDDSDHEITFCANLPHADPPEGEANPQSTPRIHNPHSTSSNNPSAEQITSNNQNAYTAPSTSAAHTNNVSSSPNDLNVQNNNPTESISS